MEISVVLTVERPHTVIQTSPEWLQEFDLCVEEAIGRAPQTNTAELFELIKTARREARSSGVLTFYTRCGQSANYDVRAKCIYDAEGRSVGCMLSLVRCEGMLRTLMRTGSRPFRTASIDDAHQGGDSRDTLVHGRQGEEIEISAVVAVEKPYRILRTSPGWLGEFEFGSQEVVGRSLAMFQGPTTNTAELFKLLETARCGKQAGGLITLYSRQGQGSAYDMRAKYIADAEGNLVGCMLSLVKCDVVSYQTATCPDGLAKAVVEAVAPSRIVQVSTEFGDQYNLLEHEVLGRTLNMILGPSSDLIKWDGFLQAGRRGLSKKAVVITYDMRECREISTNVTVRPVLGANGSVTHLVYIFQPTFDAAHQRSPPPLPHALPRTTTTGYDSRYVEMRGNSRHETHGMQHPSLLHACQQPEGDFQDVFPDPYQEDDSLLSMSFDLPAAVDDAHLPSMRPTMRSLTETTMDLHTENQDSLHCKDPLDMHHEGSDWRELEARPQCPSLAARLHNLHVTHLDREDRARVEMHTECGRTAMFAPPFSQKLSGVTSSLDVCAENDAQMMPMSCLAHMGYSSQIGLLAPPHRPHCKATQVVSTVIPRRKKQDAHLEVFGGGGFKAPSAPVKIALDVLQRLSNLSLSQAANELGISSTAMKRSCRSLGVSRWPYTQGSEEVSKTPCQQNEDNLRKIQRKHAASLKKELKGIAATKLAVSG